MAAAAHWIDDKPGDGSPTEPPADRSDAMDTSRETVEKTIPPTDPAPAIRSTNAKPTNLPSAAIRRMSPRKVRFFPKGQFEARSSGGSSDQRKNRAETDQGTARRSAARVD